VEAGFDVWTCTPKTRFTGTERVGRVEAKAERKVRKVGSAVVEVARRSGERRMVGGFRMCGK